MTFPTIPPMLPDEQLRRTQEDLNRNRRGRRWLWIFLVVSIIANLGFYLALKIKSGMTPKHTHDSIFVERVLTKSKNTDDKIAVIRVEGIIARGIEGSVGHDGMIGDIKEQIRLASEDDSVKAVVLKIDSPGGEVLASDEIYRAVKELRTGSERLHKKPVVCSMGSLAASGGFYAAMGANWIVADNLTITGSIGVIMETLNYKELFGKIGLKTVVFKSGKFKDLLNGDRDPTPDEIDLVQDLVMETYDQFVGIVAKERKIDLKLLKENIADGRIFSGKQALEHKLVDQTGTFEDAVAKAESLAGISDSNVIDYIAPFNLGSFLGIFAESRAPKIELNVTPETLKLQHGKLYYLSFHLF
jgi:protease IV